MAIPEGYRLLTAEDIGKVFGVDLEPIVYFDTSITLPKAGDFTANATIWLFETNAPIGQFLGFHYEYYKNTGGTACYATIRSSSNQRIFSFQSSSSTTWESENFTITDNVTITSYYSDYEWNTWLYVKDKDNRTPKEKFIDDTNSLAKSITDKAGTTGKKSITELKGLVDNLKTTFTGQEKTVTPSKTSQVITPDTSYDGLSKVTVNPIPTDYIIPSGTLQITENGTKDVKNYASVEVNVPSQEPTYWDGSYTLSGLGYTLTLICATSNVSVLNSDIYTYSLDSGATWNQFTSETMTLENVSKIKFKATSTGGSMGVGTTSGSNDIAYLQYYEETDDISITSNTTMYVSAHSGGGSI